ncbi:MAG: deoxyguanosinetriphosphate triphosphohydrolase, partial [Planctomycetota bacterium]
AVHKEEEKLEDFLFSSLYRDHRVVRQITKAERFVREIFNAYIDDSRQLPPEYQQWAEEVGLYQAVCDYIAGMTDRYAQDQYLQLFQPYQKL